MLSHRALRISCRGAMRTRGADDALASRRKRRAIRLLFSIALLFALLMAFAFTLACVTTVTPPTRPLDPVNVYLIDHGRTSSLVLPTADGGLIRYVYGNWDWYALIHQTLWTGLRALVWPSPGALGRHRYSGPADPANVRRIFAGWSEQIHPIVVSRPEAARLERELDARFRAHAATLHLNREYDLEFIRDPDAYHLFHDSNHVIADWLRRLGCRVRGPAFWAKWEVREGGKD